jgi:hypothetical protein
MRFFGVFFCILPVGVAAYRQGNEDSDDKPQGRKAVTVNFERSDISGSMDKKYNFFLPSVADILFVSVFLFMTLSAGQSLLLDCDTGYHIRAGQYILNTFSVPKHDIFSYISPPLPWTAHEWLSEVIMALIHRLSGLTGVVIFFALVIAFAYYLFFRILKTYGGSFLSTVIVSILVIASSKVHWLARPHIFSLPLIMIWYYLLDDYHYNGRNRLYLLPLVMLLWVNLHGGFIIGIILTIIYTSGNLFYLIFSGSGMRNEYKKKAKALGLTAAGCLLAALINPYGYHILLFPFTLTSNKIIMNSVQEFLSPNFHQWMVYTYLLFLSIAVLAFSRKGVNVVELVLVLLFIYMSLYSVRYILLFAIIVAPILIKQMDFVMKQFKGKVPDFISEHAERMRDTDASAKGLLWPVSAVIVVVFLGVSGAIGYQFDKKIKPVAAVEFLKKEHLDGHMFNNDEFGDYIIYAAWPEYRVFFDGRSDMYGAKRIEEYSQIGGIKPEWRDVLDKYKMNWIIFDAHSPLSLFLMESHEWKLIYADKVADIFVKNIPANEKLIEKYRNVKMVFDEKKPAADDNQ